MTSPDSRLARLEERSDAVRRELERISRQVDAFGPVAGQVIELLGEIKSLAEDYDELKGDMRARAGMSLALKVALIGGSFALLAAIVAAVAQIVSGS